MGQSPGNSVDCGYRPALLLAIALFAPRSVAFTQEPNLRWEACVPAERAAVLDMLAGHIRANYELLHTWSGSLEFEDRSTLEEPPRKSILRDVKERHTGEGPFLKIDTGVVVFSADLDSDKLFTKFHLKQTVVTDTETGKDVTPRAIDAQGKIREETEEYAKAPLSSILTSEHYLHCSPDHKFGRFLDEPETTAGKRPPIQAAYREPPSEGKLLSEANVVDPRRCFGTSVPPWKRLDSYAARLRPGPVRESMTSEQRKVAESITSVSRAEGDKGTLFRVTRASTPSTPFEREAVFSETAGFSIVSLRVKDDKGSVIGEATWEFSQVDGIYIPESFSVRRATWDTIEKGYFQRTLKLVESKLNQPIHPDVFTYKQFGLKDGAFVKDRIEQATYVYNAGELVAPQDYYKMQTVEGRNLLGWLLLWASPLILVAYFLTRRWVRARQR